MSRINRIPVVESPFIAPEPSVDVLLDAPVVLLPEQHDVRALIDPFHRNDSVAAAVDLVGSEGGDGFGERGKEVADGLAIVGHSRVVEVAIDVVRDALLVVLQQVSALVLRVYQEATIGEGWDDGRRRCFSANECPVVTAPHYLFGVEGEFRLRGDGERELE